MADPHPTHDMLTDLAVDDVAPQEGEALARHLRACPACRRRYDEIAVGVEDVLLAAPRIEPPPGFDRTVLNAMDLSAGPQTSRRARPPLRIVAAASVLGLVLGVGGTLAWRGLDDARTDTAAAVTLDTSEGDPVGTVTPSHLEGEPVVVVQVADGVPGREYSCVLVLANGQQVPSGSWVMDSPQATWVVPAPETGLVEVRLVTDSGVWSSAELG
jgi:hypothetical protein